MRAIVVDDSPTMRNLIKGHLNRLGWTVVGEAENGVEALELLRDKQPDLMTLDIIMPEMDGIETYRHARQLDVPPHCLIVSVLAGEPRIISAYESEIVASHFLKKPFSERDFKEKVELVMSAGAMPYPVLPAIAGEGAPAAAPTPPPAATAAASEETSRGELPPLPPIPPLPYEN